MELLANLQEDLIYSLSMLGKLAHDSRFELFIVGGVPRNLAYPILHHKDDENSENGVVQWSLEKQMLTEPLGNDIDLLINTAALPWLNSIQERFKLLTKRRLIIIEEFKLLPAWKNPEATHIFAENFFMDYFPYSLRK